MGLFTSIKWMHALGYDSMNFKSGAISIVDTVNSQHPNDKECRTISRECKCFLANSTRNSHVKFARRQANEVVYFLVKVTSSFARFHIFIDVTTCTHNLIINDMK